MPDKVVEVPGIGNVAFPDSMSDQDIALQIRKQLATQGKPTEADKSWIDSTADSISRFFGGAWRTGNPLTRENLAAGGRLVEHPADTATGMLAAQGNLATEAKKSFSQGDYLTGIRHAVSYLIPVLGPAIDQAGNKAQAGDVAGGLGEATGIAAPIALGMRPSTPAAPKLTTSKLAQEQYKIALRPRVNTPAADVREMVETGLAHELPIDETGVAKLSGLIDDLGKKINAQTEQAAQRGVTVDPKQVAERVDQVQPDFALQVNPERDLSALESTKKEFLRGPGAGPMPADFAQFVKQGTYRKIASDYGEMGTAQIEGQKALARGIKEELSRAIPELADLNEAQGKLLDLQPALESAVNRAVNSTSKGGVKSMVASGLAKSITGSSGVGLVAGLMQKVLADPALRSRLAIQINRAQQNNPAKWGAPSMKSSMAKVNALADAFDQASRPAEGSAGEP
jgi:hypothetical protein